MKATKKSMPARIKLPSPAGKPKAAASVPAYFIVNPAGGEIYKLFARYPAQPPLGPCKLKVFWSGGPFPATNIIYLIDIKHWVVAATIANGIPNVPAGQVGSVQWTLPGNFRPSDDCLDSSTYPLKYGRYQIYIQDSGQITWTYGPEFTITWSE